VRQIWINKIGGPDVLELHEGPVPQPKPGEVRIRVAAAGVNFADILIRIGLYPNAPKLPAVIGYEVSGAVDSVGEGVQGVETGTRIVALTPAYGGYSEYLCLAAECVLPIPDDLSFEKAASLPVNYLTAWLMLVRLGNLQAGERVLIHSAAGGVGQAAVQICRWRGAQVIGTASATKHERLREAGVEFCIDYRTKDFEREVQRITDGQGADVVLDAVGGSSFDKSYRCLAPLGRLFMFGVSSMVTGRKRNLFAMLMGLVAMPRFKPLQLLHDNRGVFGVSLGELGRKNHLLMGMLREIVELVQQQQLDPLVDATFSFDDVAKAHERLQDRLNFGKVLLVPRRTT